jgi:hypothetical protein
MGGSKVKTANSRWNWLYQFSGAAGMSVGIVLLFAVIDFVRTGLQPGIRNDWLSLFQNNWLVVIFKLHAGFNGIQPNLMYQMNLLDIAILALVGTTYTGLYAALRRTSKVWSLVALAQPFVGILLFMTTKTAGRSGVMGAGLVISIVMLRSQLFNTRLVSIGILSGALLLAGDLTASLAPSLFLAVLTGIGYVLLVIWFFLIAHGLFQLGSGDHRGAK